MSRVGLSLDHELFDNDLLDAGTEAILQTRDGKQRFVVPKPIGTPHFINDASMDELYAALKTHKEIVKKFPRQGAGVEAYVDAGDLGQSPEEMLKEKSQSNGTAHVGKTGDKAAAVEGAGAGLSSNGKIAKPAAVECGC